MEAHIERMTWHSDEILLRDYPTEPDWLTSAEVEQFSTECRIMPSRVNCTSLVILLGAHEFPHAPALSSSKAFKGSYVAIKDYFLSSDGFGLVSADNLLDLFDSPLSATDTIGRILDWLRERLEFGERDGTSPTDVIVYYVGHGGFEEGGSEYCLAIRSTRAEDPFTFSLQIKSLARLLRKLVREKRRLIIIDACFAAAAVKNFQSPLSDVVKQKIEDEKWSDTIVEQDDATEPVKGTSLLCASSAANPAILGEQYTRFTESLQKVLCDGSRRIPNRDFSLRDLQDLTWEEMHRKYGDDAVHPEIHSPDQRGRGDVADVRLFPNAMGRPLMAAFALVGKLTGHENHVDCVAWSPDSTLLASGSYDNSVRVWIAQTLECRAVLQAHGRGVSSVAWSPDGAMLASGSYDNTIRLWDVSTHKCDLLPNSHRASVRSVAWSINKRFLASCGEDSKVVIWDTQAKKVFRNITGMSSWTNAVAWSPDGRLLALAGGDGIVTLRSILDPKAETRFRGHRNYVNAVAWSPDGRLLASGDGNGLVILWDESTKQPTRRLKEHKDKIFKLCFSFDGRFFASQGQDRTLVWDSRTWKVIHAVNGPFPSETYLPLDFASTNLRLAGPDNDAKTIGLWELSQ